MTGKTKAELESIIDEISNPICLHDCATCGSGPSAIIPTHKPRSPWAVVMWPEWPDHDMTDGCCMASGKTIEDAIRRWNNMQEPPQPTGGSHE